MLVPFPLHQSQSIPQRSWPWHVHGLSFGGFGKHQKKPGRHAVSCSFFVTPEWRFVDLFDPISCLIQGVREKQYSMIPPPARNNNSVDNNNNNNNHTEARATTTETTIATTPLQPPSLQPSAQSSLQQQWQCYEQYCYIKILFRDTDVNTYHLVHNQHVNHLHHLPGRRSEVTGAGEGGLVGDEILASCIGIIHKPW